MYGAGWDNLIEKKYIKGTFIPNDKLAQAYGSAAIVLNDHWDDMRKWGFLSNRLFDASSAGARIITDDITGCESVSNVESIRKYNTVDDLRAMALDGWISKPLSASQRKKLHSFIESAHSFDARAAELLSGAAEARIMDQQSLNDTKKVEYAR